MPTRMHMVGGHWAVSWPLCTFILDRQHITAYPVTFNSANFTLFHTNNTNVTSTESYGLSAYIPNTTELALCK